MATWLVRNLLMLHTHWLSARNVLLRIDGSHFCCKITDLGLSRVTQGVYTHDTSQILLPIRWTALEVRSFSIALLTQGQGCLSWQN